MPLSNLQIKKIRPTDKIQRYWDEKGLYLEVTPAGGKYFRHKYRFAGKEKRLAHGVYPDTSLAEARTKRDDSRKLIAKGIDPAAHRHEIKQVVKANAESSFGSLAREWLLIKSKGWSEVHLKGVSRRLDKDVFPWLGSIPVSEITPVQVLEVLRRIEGRGAIESAHRALSSCRQIFSYAIATGRVDRNCCADLTGALTPTETTHLAAITDPNRFGQLLRLLDTYIGTPIVKAGLKLAPLLFVRPGQLRTARWEDIDLDGREWRLPPFKRHPEMIVALSSQAVGILQDLRHLTGNSSFVFPGARSHLRPMSENAITAALRRMDISGNEMTGHGFRAAARTMLDERLNIRPDFIEQQLSHTVKDPLGRAYNRTTFLEERREMMQQWADYLDLLKAEEGH